MSSYVKLFAFAREDDYSTSRPTMLFFRSLGNKVERDLWKGGQYQGTSGSRQEKEAFMKILQLESGKWLSCDSPFEGFLSCI